MIEWYWGLVNALLVALVIWLNGHGYQWGWLMGAVAQAWIMLFGIAHGAWTFVFSVIPLVMFLYNWFWHDVRRENVRAQHYEEFAELMHHVHLSSVRQATATEYGVTKEQ